MLDAEAAPQLPKQILCTCRHALVARDEREILDDPSIQLVVSAANPNERAPLGIELKRHGKDFMVDNPGATSLAQLAEARSAKAQGPHGSACARTRASSPPVNGTVRALRFGLRPTGATGRA